MLPFISCRTEYRPSNSSSSSLMALEEFTWEENWKCCLHQKQCKDIESHIIPHRFCHDHWVPCDCFSSKRKKTSGMMEQSLKQALHQDTECWNLWKLHDTQNCTLGNFVPRQKTWFPSHNCIWIATCLEGGSYPVPNKIISFDTKNCTQEGSLKICWTISISAANLAQFRMKQLWADWQAKWT